MRVCAVCCVFQALTAHTQGQCINDAMAAWHPAPALRCCGLVLFGSLGRLPTHTFPGLQLELNYKQDLQDTVTHYKLPPSK